MNRNKTNKTNIYFFQTLSRLLSLIKPQFVKCRGIFLQLFYQGPYPGSKRETEIRQRVLTAAALRTFHVVL